MRDPSLWMPYRIEEIWRYECRRSRWFQGLHDGFRGYLMVSAARCFERKHMFPTPEIHLSNLDFLINFHKKKIIKITMSYPGIFIQKRKFLDSQKRKFSIFFSFELESVKNAFNEDPPSCHRRSRNISINSRHDNPGLHPCHRGYAGCVTL